MGAEASHQIATDGVHPPHAPGRNRMDSLSPISIAHALRTSKPGRVVDQLFTAYKAEFATALGLVGMSIPFSASAIAVWAIVKKIDRFKKTRVRLAKRIAQLDASMALLRAEYSLMRAYHSPHTRRARGLREDCESGCDIPSRSVHSFWDRVLARLSSDKFIQTVSPVYFQKKLAKATREVTMELTQINGVMWVQHMFDHNAFFPKEDTSARESQRRWRQAIRVVNTI